MAYEQIAHLIGKPMEDVLEETYKKIAEVHERMDAWNEVVDHIEALDRRLAALEARLPVEKPGQEELIASLDRMVSESLTQAMKNGVL